MYWLSESMRMSVEISNGICWLWVTPKGIPSVETDKMNSSISDSTWLNQITFKKEYKPAQPYLPLVKSFSRSSEKPETSRPFSALTQTIWRSGNVSPVKRAKLDSSLQQLDVISLTLLIVLNFSVWIIYWKYMIKFILNYIERERERICEFVELN